MSLLRLGSTVTGEKSSEVVKDRQKDKTVWMGRRMRKKHEKQNSWMKPIAMPVTAGGNAKACNGNNQNQHTLQPENIIYE